MPASTIVRTTLAPSVEAQVIGSNQRRKRLTISTGSAAVVYFRNDSLGNVVGGLAASLGGGPLVMDKADYGDWVEMPLFAFCIGAAEVAILETTD
jgi:hypothetical protein